MVGEIHDEFDVVEHPLALPDGALVFDGAIKVRDLETQYNISLPDDSSYETIGGFVIHQLGFIPRGGESFEASGYRFTVMDMDHRRVSRVKVKSLRPVETQPSASESFQIETPQPAPASKKPRKPRVAKPRHKSVAPVDDQPIPLQHGESAPAEHAVPAPASHEPAPNANERTKNHDSSKPGENSAAHENTKTAENK
jgi:putative hemolysin